MPSKLRDNGGPLSLGRIRSRPSPLLGARYDKSYLLAPEARRAPQPYSIAGGDAGASLHGLVLRARLHPNLGGPTRRHLGQLLRLAGLRAGAIIPDTARRSHSTCRPTIVPGSATTSLAAIGCSTRLPPGLPDMCWRSGAARPATGACCTALVEHEDGGLAFRRWSPVLTSQAVPPLRAPARGRRGGCLPGLLTRDDRRRAPQVHRACTSVKLSSIFPVGEKSGMLPSFAKLFG